MAERADPAWRALLAPYAPLFDDADLAAYETGARGPRGRALAVVRPASEAQVVELLALCARRGTRLQVQGANTGLVGASTPDDSGTMLVLSTERLTQIGELAVDDLVVSVQAGVRLSALNAALRPHGVWFPIDLGADPSIGGMLATNTGGARMLRYGDVRARVAAVRCALPPPHAQIVTLGRGLEKDNSGLDLRQLLVGSAGTLGIVTGATLRVAPLPAQTSTAWLALRSIDDALDLWTRLHRSLQGFLSAFEGVSGTALRLALDHVPRLRAPFARTPAYSVLLELATSLTVEELDLDALLEVVLARELEHGVEDVVVGRPADLWAIRHALSEAQRAAGRVIGFDVALPRAAIPAFVAAARSGVAGQLPGAIAADFGHWGDGGVHFNVVLPHGLPVDEPALGSLRRALWGLAVETFGGSFSAEHGIGPANLDAYRQHTPLAVRTIAAGLQRQFDPHGVLRRVDFA